MSVAHLAFDGNVLSGRAIGVLGAALQVRFGYGRLLKGLAVRNHGAAKDDKHDWYQQCAEAIEASNGPLPPSAFLHHHHHHQFVPCGGGGGGGGGGRGDEYIYGGGYFSGRHRGGQQDVRAPAECSEVASRVPFLQHTAPQL